MLKIIKELIPYVIIVLVVFLIRTFIVTPIFVQGDSMVPTLKGNELMILKKYDKDYERFDIVVVKKGVYKDNLIKRVIGLPGEKIEYSHGKLYIDDKEVKDVHAYGDTDSFKSITLKDNEYFVMGDNREVSLDSRILGPVTKDDIKGTVGIIIYPFNRIGKVK